MENKFKCLALLGLFVIAESACPTNYQSLDGSCFQFYKTASAYSDARTQCQSDTTDLFVADLAILNDCSLFGDIVKYIHINGIEAFDGYWIGATDASDEGTWLWVDASTVEMGAPFWGSNGTGTHQPDNAGDDPGEDCAYLDSTDQYYFHDGDCMAEKWFICQASSVTESSDYEEDVY